MKNVLYKKIVNRYLGFRIFNSAFYKKNSSWPRIFSAIPLSIEKSVRFKIWKSVLIEALTVTFLLSLQWKNSLCYIQEKSGKRIIGFASEKM